MRVFSRLIWCWLDEENGRFWERWLNIRPRWLGAKSYSKRSRALRLWTDIRDEQRYIAKVVERATMATKSRYWSKPSRKVGAMQAFGQEGEEVVWKMCKTAQKWELHQGLERSTSVFPSHLIVPPSKIPWTPLLFINHYLIAQNSPKKNQPPSNFTYYGLRCNPRIPLPPPSSSFTDRYPTWPGLPAIGLLRQRGIHPGLGWLGILGEVQAHIHLTILPVDVWIRLFWIILGEMLACDVPWWLRMLSNLDWV